MEENKPNFINFDPEKVYKTLISVLEAKYNVKITYELARKPKSEE